MDKSNTKLKHMTKEEKAVFEEKFNAIYRNLAKIRHESPDSDVAQAEIKVWYEFLIQMGNYSPEAFKGLGQIYVDDELFTKNIDQFGDGLALFMRDEMKNFEDKQD